MRDNSVVPEPQGQGKVAILVAISVSIVLLVFDSMQCKRRRYDIASTEVGEVSGGRVTQQAFDASTRRTAKSTMQRCQEREATVERSPRKRK